MVYSKIRAFENRAFSFITSISFKKSLPCEREVARRSRDGGIVASLVKGRCPEGAEGLLKTL